MKLKNIALIAAILSIWGMLICAPSAWSVDEASVPIQLCELPMMIGPAVQLTEVGFDWTDEWLEITNIWDSTYEWPLHISGAKSKDLSLSVVTILPWQSVLVWDYLKTIGSWVIVLASGQGLSIPDTTWFTITVWGSGFLDESLFDAQTISSIPDWSTIEVIYSGDERLRVQSQIPNQYILSWTIATPGEIHCSVYDETIVNDGVTGWRNDGIVTSWTIEQSWDTSHSAQNEESSSQQDLSWAWNTNDAWLSTSWDIEQSGGINGEWQNDGVSSSDDPFSEETWLSEATNSSFLPPIPCSISEIHPSTDIYPEYVELFCAHSFSGTLFSLWIGWGSAIKQWPVSYSTGSYHIVASSTSGFIDPLVVTLLSGVSLLDDGETLSLWANGYETGEYSYPTVWKWHSYYPALDRYSLSSPGFSEQYVLLYDVIPPAPVVITNTVTDSKDYTYYQSLYHTRKDKATTLQTQITQLKKAATIGNASTKTQPKSNGTTWTSALLTKSTTTVKNLSTSSVSTPKVSKTSSTKKTTSSTKTTTSKSSSKAKTVSTTSKAYVQLVDEHKLYKAYIDFMHTYLREHLYNEYTTLHIPDLKTLLSTAVKSVRNQQYTVIPTTGTEVSVYDFTKQRETVSLPVSMDALLPRITHIYKDIVQSLVAPLLHDFIWILYAKEDDLIS